MITIRVISIKNDFDDYLTEYIKLCNLEWGDHKSNYELKKYIKDKKYDIQFGNKVIEILALINNNIMIGFISLFMCDGDERKDLSPWYATMYIKKEYRGKGYSKILNNEIIKIAKNKGYNKIYLKSNLLNYYEKFGAIFIEKLQNGENLFYIDIKESDYRTMKKNKLILFDWGNIVESHKIGYTCHKAFNDLFKACGYIGEKEIFYSLSHYKLSTIPTIDDFEKTFNMMKKEFKLKVDYKKFIELYNYYFDKIDYHKDVRDYEISLKDKCYIGIFSNLTIFDKKRLDKQVGLKNYDYVFLSFEMNNKKPNEEIFLMVEEKIPFNKKDILFIDDRSDNIEIAKKIGWNTLQATGLELDKIKEVCKKFIDYNDNQ